MDGSSIFPLLGKKIKLPIFRKHAACHGTISICSFMNKSFVCCLIALIFNVFINSISNECLIAPFVILKLLLILIPSFYSLIFGEREEHLLQRCLTYRIIFDVQCIFGSFHETKHFRPFDVIRWRYIVSKHALMLLPEIDRVQNINRLSKKLIEFKFYFK